MHRGCHSHVVKSFWDDGAGVRAKDDHADCQVSGDAGQGGSG